MTTKVKLPDGMPRAMRSLPRNSAGYPIPFFVEYIDGVPDFRVMSASHLKRATLEGLCWLCGETLHRDPQTRKLAGVFVAGPMCLVNKNSAEPPCHEECAAWSARACPFLVNPNKVRREHGVETLGENVAGISIDRNPGVTALIRCTTWTPYIPQHGGSGVLFRMGKVTEVEWVREGRTATTDEVLHSLETGLPALQEIAAEEGHEAERALAVLLIGALTWIGDYGAQDRCPVIHDVIAKGWAK